MPPDLSFTFEKVADALADTGISIVDTFLSRDEVDNILSGDEFVHHKLHFRKAGIGKIDKQVNEGIRGDFIQWIDPQQASSAEQLYIEKLRALIRFLNQSLFLSLKDIEIHRTVYPIGTFYQRHKDQFRTDDHRKLSIICYLNENWKTEHGGQLRIYLPGGPQDILPLAGRLVCFRSDQVEHEVLPATRERYSLTGWAVDRPLSL